MSESVLRLTLTTVESRFVVFCFFSVFLTDALFDSFVLTNGTLVADVFEGCKSLVDDISKKRLLRLLTERLNCSIFLMELILRMRFQLLSVGNKTGPISIANECWNLCILLGLDVT